ncbi:hypothetical protein M7I_4819 [Glarea lozoyensis 74030]|uniref:Uncharacterized protein n=1 Tax=Glarea lozoyensis (strain ATCC 74030 / MF5533) TaxID=1104152 RepID=H0EQ74_GLAL7|nr:hypothetical protein M7I_4819 [Glarea lozoyensis 74030]
MLVHKRDERLGGFLDHFDEWWREKGAGVSELYVPDFGADKTDWKHVSVGVAVDVGHEVGELGLGDIPVPDVVEEFCNHQIRTHRPFLGTMLIPHPNLDLLPNIYHVRDSYSSLKNGPSLIFHFPWHILHKYTLQTIKIRSQSMIQYAPASHTQNLLKPANPRPGFINKLRVWGIDVPWLFSEIVKTHVFKHVVACGDARRVAGSCAGCCFEDVHVVAVAFEKDGVHEAAEGATDLVGLETSEIY